LNVVLPLRVKTVEPDECASTDATPSERLEAVSVLTEDKSDSL
jgi:hypothetical protein